MSVPRPARRCSHPGCTHTATSGTARCTTHAIKPWSRSPITPERKRIRYGSRYQAQRKRVLTRDDHMCVCCGSTRTLQVHHLVDADVVEDEDLVTLCVKCHRGVEAGNRVTVARLRALGWQAGGR
jgi:5-methylcytosine-specific restriction protein A